MLRRWTILLVAVVLVLLAIALIRVLSKRAALRGDAEAATAVAGAAAAAAVPAPVFDDPFWKHWGDGRAELAGYDLVYPRYGEPRRGTAVTIFVTETFSNALRVKSDPGKHPVADEFPVMKLNLVQDFPTGIYDYNLLTSAFVALAPVNGRPAGSATKVSFSAQEWCGHVYGQLLFDHGAARLTSHSYFDGEADRDERLEVQDDALDEDALMLWARGLAAPLVDPGQSREAPLVRSLRLARMTHQPVTVERATLARAAAPHTVTVPAGSFEARACTVTVGANRTWTFEVETVAPHRLLSWECSNGEKAQLLAAERLVYWKMNGSGFRDAVAKLGLKPRPERTP